MAEQVAASYFNILIESHDLNIIFSDCHIIICISSLTLAGGIKLQFIKEREKIERKLNFQFHWTRRIFFFPWFVNFRDIKNCFMYKVARDIELQFPKRHRETRHYLQCTPIKMKVSLFQSLISLTGPVIPHSPSNERWRKKKK